MTDDLRDRLTTALMDAMGCEQGYLPLSEDCRQHAVVFLSGVLNTGCRDHEQTCPSRPKESA